MSETPPQVYRLGVDIGGTFTDIILLSGDGTSRPLKLPSTPPNFGQAVMAGVLQLVRELDLSPKAIKEVLHGTTVATNAILEGRGAKTALVTTKGFRDVLELGRLRYPALYDLFWDKPKPLVPRRLRFELDFRIDAKGELETAMSEGSLDRVLCCMREEGIESIALTFINSYRNPTWENSIADMVRAELPETYVSASVAIMPEIKEYERTSTTVVNAYVQPVVDRYVQALERDLGELGVAGKLHIMQSSGGLLNADVARATPVRIIESGPAAGVVATQFLARLLGLSNLIAFDMGGTTAKASLIESGQPFEASEYEVGGGMNTRHGLTSGAGYRIRVPSLDIAEVGAGGGSICWIDDGGAPRVGPQSAGAVPGPACYGRGGMLPTLTDANVVLGYFNAEALAGGIQRVDQKRAATALQEQFADPLGLSLLEAAHGVYTIAVTNMSRAVRAVTTERGRDPRDFTLVAFGGAGPAYAVEMAREFGIAQVLVPMTPGLFSAIGLLVADVQHHEARSWTRREHIDLHELNETFVTMERAALCSLSGQGYAPEHVSLERFADLRYMGQSSDLRIPIPPGHLTAEALRDVRERFDLEHERTYGHRGDEQHMEIVNLRVRATHLDPERRQFDVFQTRPSAAEYDRQRRDAPTVRSAYFGEPYGSLEVPVLHRSDLTADYRPGPVIIEDMDATTLIPPGSWVLIDSLGNLIIKVH